MAIEIPCVAVISMEWRPLWGSWNGNAHVIRFSRDWQAARVMFVGILVSMLEVVRPGPTISYSLCSLVGWAFWWQPHLYNYKLRLPPPLDVRERLFLRPIGPVWPRPESWSLAHFAKSTSFSRKVALILPSSSWVVVLLLLQIRQLNNGYIIHLIWMCISKIGLQLAWTTTPHVVPELDHQHVMATNCLEARKNSLFS